MKKYRFLCYGFFAGISILLLFLFGCKKKKLENELITTVKVSLSEGVNAPRVYFWKDTDGPGGKPPILPDTIQLDSGLTYNAKIEFLDESGSSVKSITDIIRTEASNHIVCYHASINLLEISIKDSDGKYPLGLASEWQSKFRGKCSLQVVLRHQPGIKDGTCNPGDTDVSVMFEINSK
jgi:hypothetical protein